MDQFPTPPRFRFTLPIAALIGCATLSSFLGFFVFLLLCLADILLTPVLWVMSRLLHRTKLSPPTAQWIMWLPWLGLAAFMLYGTNGYFRERNHVKTICNGRLPAELRILDSKESFGKDFGIYQAIIRSNADELRQMLELPLFVLEEHSPILSSDFMIDLFPPSPTVNLRYYARDDWRKNYSGAKSVGWIITDDSFAWAYVYYCY